MVTRVFDKYAGAKLKHVRQGHRKDNERVRLDFADILGRSMTMGFGSSHGSAITGVLRYGERISECGYYLELASGVNYPLSWEARILRIIG